MPSDAGWKQEQKLFSYLLSKHCVEVIQGDRSVRAFLGMKGLPKCADALGFHHFRGAATGYMRVTVAESKGTDMNSAVEQLGNAAAGVFEKFGRETKIELLLVVSSFEKRPSGALSPGPGYRVEPLRTGRDNYSLHEATADGPIPVRARVAYSEWSKWSPRVALLPLVVRLASDLS